MPSLQLNADGLSAPLELYSKCYHPEDPHDSHRTCVRLAWSLMHKTCACRLNTSGHRMLPALALTSSDNQLYLVSIRATLYMPGQPEQGPKLAHTAPLASRASVTALGFCHRTVGSASKLTPVFLRELGRLSDV